MSVFVSAFVTLESELYDLSALYRLFKSLYSHIYRAYRGQKGETEFGYRETWHSTTATLVLVRAWSTAPIHGIALLRPHPSDDDEYDGYIQWKYEWYVGASSGHLIRSVRNLVSNMEDDTFNERIRNKNEVSQSVSQSVSQLACLCMSVSLVSHNGSVVKTQT